MTPVVPVILASRSPRRHDAMRALGLPYEVRVSHVEAGLPTGIDPCDPVPIAVAKVRDIAGGVEQSTVVLGADTIVVDDIHALGKPVDGDDAVSMLMHLRGRTHGVRTGVALSYLGTVTSLEVSATVRMRNFDATTARAYVATGEPLDCAGSYDARAGGAALVEEVSGCLAAVIGFPVLSVATLLRTHASLASVVDPIAACVALCNAPCRAGDPATRHECLPAMTSGSRTPA